MNQNQNATKRQAMKCKLCPHLTFWREGEIATHFTLFHKTKSLIDNTEVIQN
jgi:hypothetical protein